nr:zinc-binding dehydrogenase [Clostridiales bacterium]
SAVYNGFSKCFVKPGEYALVVGAGPIGCCHAMMLHMAGAVVAMNDISSSRLAQVKEKFPYIQTCCGDDLPGFVNSWTDGRGLDIAITACPVPSVQAAMLPLMNYGGRVNFFGGIPETLEPVAINTNFIHYKELIVTGSTRQSTAQYRTIMSFIASGLLDVRSIITDRYCPEESLQAFENAAAAKGIKHVIEF